MKKLVTIFANGFTRLEVIKANSLKSPEKNKYSKIGVFLILFILATSILSLQNSFFLS
ncbi:hypothetical protein C723_0477 [Christiangramia flava JLT2011]|uniref:Uncharacterized protein n=1 Tax=Christiangramia flava JLT2011 TaxID=1229726 RepID=A0A1L7I3G0_9FLAO|nr:hypothetical protein GRFL_1423 [Christiangramia flava JLT2011]OSS41068.1 hypothetical protein C723_0477 [Christiangramia flava JLT2011]